MTTSCRVASPLTASRRRGSGPAELSGTTALPRDALTIAASRSWSSRRHDRELAFTMLPLRFAMLRSTPLLRTTARLAVLFPLALVATACSDSDSDNDDPNDPSTSDPTSNDNGGSRNDDTTNGNGDDTAGGNGGSGDGTASGNGGSGDDAANGNGGSSGVSGSSDTDVDRTGPLGPDVVVLGRRAIMRSWLSLRSRTCPRPRSLAISGSAQPRRATSPALR